MYGFVYLSKNKKFKHWGGYLCYFVEDLRSFYCTNPCGGSHDMCKLKGKNSRWVSWLNSGRSPSWHYCSYYCRVKVIVVLIVVVSIKVDVGLSLFNKRRYNGYWCYVKNRSECLGRGGRSVLGLMRYEVGF